MSDSAIFKQINKEINDYNTQEATVIDSYKFNQKNIIEKVTRLYHSQFEKGQIDSEGFRKYFLNIVRNPCDVATKAISFGTSDINIIPAPGQNHLKAWFLDRDVKHWMKKTGFSKTLKRIFYELPIFGTVVLKKVKGKLHVVDLRNLIVEQSADSLLQSSYVIETHFMSPQEVRKMNWDSEKVEEAIKLWRDTKKPFMRVYERRGEVPESWLKENGDQNKYVRSRFIVFSPQSTGHGQFDSQGFPKQGVILSKNEESEKDFPYREIHWEKIPGRWLGVGRVELNADPQIRMNEITNLRVKSSYFAALNIWQSRDTSAPKNLVQEVANGEILNVISEITRIPTEERNLAAFSEEEQGWMSNRDEQSMSFDVVRGERLPAGTPLGSARLAAQMTSSYFDDIRERVAIDVREIIQNDVIEDFLRENNEEHYLRVTGEDYEHFTSLMIVEKTNQKVLEFVLKNKKVPTQTQYDAIRGTVAERERSGKEDSLKIPKDFYEDTNYEIDIVITEEARKMQAQSANMTTILQAIQQDDTLLTDPNKRRIFSQLLSSIGMSLADVEGPETGQVGGVEASARQNQLRGGGISAPNANQAQQETEGEIEQTV